MRTPKENILAAALGLLFVLVGVAQQPIEKNYSEIFSNDYQRALQFLKKEKWIDSTIRKHDLNPREITAIAFPELIRYNSIQDKIETFTLETLYVQYGKAYANFSVSKFQIKPSFAEDIEIDFLKLFGEEKMVADFQINASDTIQNQENRLNRLKRLKDKTTAVNYLCLYFMVMDSRFRKWKNGEEKIKFLACAYNCGYRKTKKEIDSFLTKKFFHTGLAVASAKYCYADISWYYFLKP